MKDAAKHDIYRSSGCVVTEILSDLSNQDEELPNYKNLQRYANRAREQLRPKNPSHKDFEVLVYIQLKQYYLTRFNNSTWQVDKEAFLAYRDFQLICINIQLKLLAK